MQEYCSVSTSFLQAAVKIAGYAKKIVLQICSIFVFKNSDIQKTTECT